MNEHEEIVQLLVQNQQLLKENASLLEANNKILQQQVRRAKIALIVKFIWVIVFLALPFLLLPYIMSGLTNGLGFNPLIPGTLETTNQNLQEALKIINTSE